MSLVEEKYSEESLARGLAERIMATQKIIDIMLEDGLINKEGWLAMSQRAQDRQTVAEHLRALVVTEVDYEEDPLARLAMTYVRIGQTK